MPWFGGSSHMLWMTMGWVVGIAFVVALFWLLFSAARGGIFSADRPEAVLRRRYAAGEIDTDEFQLRLSELRKSKGPRDR
jgi:putative membrane protein